MSINNMKVRVNYQGGSSQVARMNADKLKSLKRALVSSYQAATAILSDGREFRCLINPNKLSVDLDNKIISIPFKDICLNGTAVPRPPVDDGSNDSNNSNGSNEEQLEDMEDLVSILSIAAHSEGSWEDMDDPTDPEPEAPDINPDEPTPIIPSNGEEEIGLKEGDVITWKETNSHWLIYLRRFEETAYFRGEMRRCRYELSLGNGSKYWAYVRGPVEKDISWIEEKGNYFNKLNNSLLIYITQTEETLKYFSRFKKIMINGQPWEVQSVDSISTPGLLELSLKETYNNIVETNIEEAVKRAETKEIVDEQEGVYIHGVSIVYPYDVRTYELKNYHGAAGTWKIKNESKKNIVKMNAAGDSIELSIVTSKSGSFTLVYEVNEQVIAALDITIDSL